MAPPEPEISIISALEETQTTTKDTRVQDIDPLESPSRRRCERVMDTAVSPVAKIPRMETEASCPERSDVTIAIQQNLCLPQGPNETHVKSDSIQDSPETEDAFEDRFHWNMYEVQTRFQTPEQCVKFAENRGLIPTKKLCSYHRRPMLLRCTPQNPLGSFRCTKQRCGGRKKIHRAVGTWFSNASIPITTVFQLMYMYCHQYKYLDAQRTSAGDEGKMLSTRTICSWYSYCRETVIVYHLEHQEAEYKFGGLGKTVYIKQVKISERKFNSGKHIEGQWVLVMMETGNDDLRLELCPDDEESAKMLLPMIVEKHIKAGTEIRTSSWVAYHCLSNHGFVHKTECKTENGIEELVHKHDDSSAGNGIEEPEGTHEAPNSYWNKLNTSFKRYQYKNFTDWLVEYSWRQKVRKSHKCPFEELLKAVKYVY